MLRAIYDCPIPTIAAVNGAAAGAGANLALACDVVIAAHSAVFIQAFARIGLIPDAGGTYWLPRQIGFARAMGAALFAEPVTADAGRRLGDDLGGRPRRGLRRHRRRPRRASSPAARPPPTACIKQALRASLANDLARAARRSRPRSRARPAARRDFREGVAAFLEKRPARYEGR